MTHFCTTTFFLPLLFIYLHAYINNIKYVFFHLFEWQAIVKHTHFFLPVQRRENVLCMKHAFTSSSLEAFSHSIQCVQTFDWYSMNCTKTIQYTEARRNIRSNAFAWFINRTGRNTETMVYSQNNSSWRGFIMCSSLNYYQIMFVSRSYLHLEPYAQFSERKRVSGIGRLNKNNWASDLFIDNNQYLMCVCTQNEYSIYGTHVPVQYF